LGRLAPLRLRFPCFFFARPKCRSQFPLSRLPQPFRHRTPPPAGRPHLADDPNALAAAAARVKLWEPDSLSKVAASFPGADKSLEDWLVSWQARLASGKTDEPLYIGGLESALGKSKLTPAQCVQLAGIARKWEDTAADAKPFQRYHPVTAAFARDAVWKASAVIHSDPDNFQKVQATIAPLIRRLWYGLEPDLSKVGPDLLAVREFYSLLEQFNPDGSPDHHRGQDGRIETMILGQDFAGAEKEASAALADSSNLSSDERADFAYLEGWSLYYLSRYAEAVRFLCVAVDRENCEKCDRAFRLLAISKAHLGDVSGVNETLRTWANRFHPTPEDAVPVFRLTDEARANAKGGADGPQEQDVR